MLTRRTLIGAGAGAALLAPFARLAPAAAATGPALRFGVIADPQYAPVAPQASRFYSSSLWKLTEAIDDFNAQDLAFVATLGDTIERGWESYGHVLPLYDRLVAPHHFALGNHDHAVAAEHHGAVRQRFGMQTGYYDYAAAGYRFLILDGTEISTFGSLPGSAAHAQATERLARLAEAGAPNARSSNGTMSETQFAWVEARLEAAKAAGERVVVQAHYPVYPVDGSNLWDDARLVALLTGYDNVVLYLNGHNHAGNYGRIGDLHFLNLKGMVETRDTTAYAVVELWDERVEILGRGREARRTLPLSRTPA